MKQPQTADTMSTSAIIKKTVVNACCIFTGITCFLLLIQWIIEKGFQMSFAVEIYLMLIPLSLCISGAGMIRRSQSIATGVKCLLHPLLCLGGIFLVYLPYMISNHFPASKALVHIFVFVIMYGVITAAVCVISLARHRHHDEKEAAPYVSQFKADNKNRKD